jgi:hypothetical protein
MSRAVWTPLSPMAAGRSGHTATLVEGDAAAGAAALVVVFGGVVDRTQLLADLLVRTTCVRCADVPVRAWVHGVVQPHRSTTIWTGFVMAARVGLHNQ